MFDMLVYFLLFFGIIRLFRHVFCVEALGSTDSQLKVKALEQALRNSEFFDSEMAIEMGKS